MDMLSQDLRYALRMLAKSPGFAAVTVLTLAICIGANTAIFSVVNAVLLAPLPYPEGDRLVIAVRKKPGVLRTIASYPDFTDWQASKVFAKSAAIVGRGFFIDAAEGPQALHGGRVSEEFFETLAVQPALGRGFLPGEAQENEKVAVISHELWTTHLGGDRQAVGKDLRLRGATFRIVGILPPGFRDPLNPLVSRDLYIPLVVSPDERVSRNSQWLQVIGRLAPGKQLGQAQAEIEAISERGQKATVDVRSLSPFTLVPVREHQVGKAEGALWLLMGAVGFVLLIGCANVSNLLLARITARQHELAVRAAVGAGARRLAAQLATESLLLSGLGGAGALVFVLWALDVVKAVSPVDLPRLDAARLDLRVFVFATLATAAAGLLFGLLPVLRGARQDVLTTLKQATGAGSLSHTRARQALLVAEVALAMILAIGATLAVASFQRLQRVDSGFQASNVLTAMLTYPGEWPHAQQVALVEQVRERLQALPGVRAVGAVDNLPVSGSWSQYTMTADRFAEGSRPELKGLKVEFQQGVVGGDYFAALQIPLKAGRWFDAADHRSETDSVIVGEALARRVWGDSNPLGRRTFPGQNQPAIVVGVAGDVRHFGPDTQPAPTLYRPLGHKPAWGLTLVVRTERNPTALVSAVRESIRAVDPAVAIQRIRTMEEWLSRRTAGPRFLAALLATFGAAALALAMLGIYGVMSYSIHQRTREMGVRMALGARPAAVLRLVIGGGMRLAGAGVALGLLGAWALSRFLEGQLFEVRPTEPSAYAGVAAALAAAALAACWIPARRAARVDPLKSLRYE
jgi:predicted permease